MSLVCIWIDVVIDVFIGGNQIHAVVAWSDSIAEYLNLNKAKTRKSLDRNIPSDYVFNVSNIGHKFPFKGRRAEACMVYDSVIAQERLRLLCKKAKTKKKYDEYKRQLVCAVSRGLSGCGKTTLFREFESIYYNEDPSCVKLNIGCNLRLGK